MKNFKDDKFSSISNFEENKEDKNVLSLKGKGLKTLDFLSKFIRVHPHITDIDISGITVPDVELRKFADSLKENISVQNIHLGKKKLSRKLKRAINKETQINKMIKSLVIPELAFATTQNVLNLKKKKMKDIGFIHKFLQDYSSL